MDDSDAAVRNDCSPFQDDDRGDLGRTTVVVLPSKPLPGRGSLRVVALELKTERPDPFYPSILINMTERKQRVNGIQVNMTERLGMKRNHIATYLVRLDTSPRHTSILSFVSA